jgi:hypothetical protein
MWQQVVRERVPLFRESQKQAFQIARLHLVGRHQEPTLRVPARFNEVVEDRSFRSFRHGFLHVDEGARLVPMPRLGHRARFSNARNGFQRPRGSIHVHSALFREGSVLTQR